MTMQPNPSLPETQFHDWYNNEHGPTRLRLPFVNNGFRYRGSDIEAGAGSPEKPEWMAIYDVTDMEELTKDAYLRLRDPPVKSQRETDTMKQIKMDRKLYDYIEGRESKDFKKLEDVQNEGQGNVMVVVALDVYPDKKAELEKWYREEHIELLSRVPGWLRSRRFVTSSIDSEAPIEYLAIHEYAPKNGLGGPEFKSATTTEWNEEIYRSVVSEKRRRVFDLYYTFGPAPRYLAPHLSSWELSDPKSTKTRVIPNSIGGAGAIESWVTTKDGVELSYRLEGSPDPSAPLIILNDAILADYPIWDSFISTFYSDPTNKKYRIVRSSKRGRTSKCGTQPITIDVLAADIITILDALRVIKATVIGVSLGGATALCTALKYPDRVEAFISCDTSAKSPAGNSKAWGERVALAEKEGATISGEAVVGSELAEATTRRWFVPESYDGGEVEGRIEEVKKMVETNSLHGFRRSVEALFEYDLKDLLRGSKVKSAFVVGSGDGVLPESMQELAASYGAKGGAFKVIEGAGHLPMVEKPESFAEFVTEFLKG